MKYLVIDGMRSGTGIREFYSGEHLDLSTLGLSNGLIQRVEDWQARYHAHANRGYEPDRATKDLDQEGMRLAEEVKTEVLDSKVAYYSDATSIAYKI